jgi:hypothetical protein
MHLARARGRYEESVSDELSVVGFEEHSAGPGANTALDEDRPPWAAIVTIGALLVFYVLVILATSFARQSSATAANTTGAQPAASSTTISPIGTEP